MILEICLWYFWELWIPCSHWKSSSALAENLRSVWCSWVRAEYKVNLRHVGVITFNMRLDGYWNLFQHVCMNVTAEVKVDICSRIPTFDKKANKATFWETEKWKETGRKRGICIFRTALTVEFKIMVLKHCSTWVTIIMSE